LLKNDLKEEKLI